MKTEIRQHLNDLQIAMRLHSLWEETPPSAEALASDEPFCVSTLSPTQWLQWIFIPRMNALLDADAEIPRNFAITPYLEEAVQNETHLEALHLPLLKLERLLKAD
ncbi:anhydro-N-acetylmuramic acid kinase [Pasteurellaceae bacterium Orientalotternb1]|nr:anhydro-N-acetylmuramic acid kinase [Pasteurellaceae bacterium Orientalotternb1]